MNLKANATAELENNDCMKFKNNNNNDENVCPWREAAHKILWKRITFHVAQIKRFRNRVTLRSRDRKPIGFEFFWL